MKKFRIRKTGEIIDVICFCGDSTERDNKSDFVSYTDSNGIEHYKEPLNYYWDLEEIESTKMPEIKKDIDWEKRSYELAKAYSIEFVKLQHEQGRTECGILFTNVVKWSVELADMLIEELKNRKS